MCNPRLSSSVVQKQKSADKNVFVFSLEFDVLNFFHRQPSYLYFFKKLPLKLAKNLRRKNPIKKQSQNLILMNFFICLLFSRHCFSNGTFLTLWKYCLIYLLCTSIVSIVTNRGIKVATLP